MHTNTTTNITTSTISRHRCRCRIILPKLDHGIDGMIFSGVRFAHHFPSRDTSWIPIRIGFPKIMLVLVCFVFFLVKIGDDRGPTRCFDEEESIRHNTYTAVPNFVLWIHAII